MKLSVKSKCDYSVQHYLLAVDDVCRRKYFVYSLHRNKTT